jgi:dihydrofolate reductase
MATLIRLNTQSLDGYIADEEGRFDFTEPDEEVHAFINDLMRPVGTFLFGRRNYEVMRVWEDLPLEDEPPPVREFAEIWHAADKIVYSTTLEAPTTARTRLEREFDPEAVRRMKAEADRDLAIAGPGLAAHAFRAGLVDEIQVFVAQAVVGGGTRFLPDGVRLDLELLDERRFGNGTVFLRYRVRG